MWDAYQDTENELNQKHQEIQQSSIDSLDTRILVLPEVETKPRDLCLLGEYYANNPHLWALDIGILEHSFKALGLVFKGDMTETFCSDLVHSLLFTAGTKCPIDRLWEERFALAHNFQIAVHGHCLHCSRAQSWWGETPWQEACSRRVRALSSWWAWGRQREEESEALRQGKFQATHFLQLGPMARLPPPPNSVSNYESVNGSIRWLVFSPLWSSHFSIEPLTGDQTFNIEAFWKVH